MRITAEGAALDATAVRVRGLGGVPGAVEERRVIDIPVSNGWPIEVAIEPLGGDAARIWRVEAWALDNGVELGAGAREGSFTADTLVEERLVLKPGVNLGALPEPTADDDDAGAPSSIGDAAADGSSPAPPDGGVMDGGDGATTGDGGSAGDPCATNNGGCDALVSCTSAGAAVTCGACPEGYDDANGDSTLCAVGGACGITNVCSAAYPCQNLSEGYTCRGQFADWPTGDSASSFTVSADGTVADSRTGLEWQRSVDSATYNWVDAQSYCTELSLVGTGWRLPTKAELESIVDVTRSDPAIDPTTFPDTPPMQYWSSSPVTGGEAGRAFLVSFNYGYSTVGDTGSRTDHVRCVRSSIIAFPSTGSGGAPPGRYVVNADGTVLDSRTMLTWEQAVDSGSFTWAEAQIYCADLMLAGGGWRLPKVSELLTLVDPTRYSPAIDSTIFPNTPADPFYSSSEYVPSPGLAWRVFFSDGTAYSNASSDSGRVRCVR